MPGPDSEQFRWFTEEVQPHEPELRAFLRRRFPTLQDIDDLVQESYARLMRARDAGAIVEPRAYLFATARNIAFDVFRRHRPVSLEDLEENERLSVVEERADAAESASHAQEVELLVAAIYSLPERCREILTLRKSTDCRTATSPGVSASRKTPSMRNWPSASCGAASTSRPAVS